MSSRSNLETDLLSFLRVQWGEDCREPVDKDGCTRGEVSVGL